MKNWKIPILVLLITVSLISVLSVNVEYSAMDLRKFRSYQELRFPE